MAHIVWLTGAFTALWGVVILFKPAWLKQTLVIFNKGKLVYAVAGLKTLLGVIFLIFARECKLPGVIIAFGILMAGGSILFCLLPFAKIQAYLNWWIAKSVWLYRLWAVAAMLIGGFMMYAGVPN